MADPILKPLRVLAAALALATLLGACQSSEPANRGPNPAVVGALARGVNLSAWFTFRTDTGHAGERYQVSADDLDWIAKRGFRHVRIPFDPAWFLGQGDAPLKASAVTELRQAVIDAQARGLLVVLSMQPETAAKQRIAAQPAALQAAARFWRLLAAELADLPAERLVFEALNEPEIESAAASRAVVGTLADAIRAAAPEHTIVVAGHRWSSLPELLALEPYADRNRVYAFHFYDPHNFTHQGADWGWDMWRQLAGLPYPSSPESVSPLLDLLPAQTHAHISHYGEQRWGRARLAGLLDQAAAYARAHGVFVWCSEFGVYRYNVREEHRRAWLWDVRTLLEERKLGWTLWDYAGRFGVVTGEPGQRKADAVVIDALGLKPSP